MKSSVPFVNFNNQGRCSQMDLHRQVKQSNGSEKEDRIIVRQVFSKDVQLMADRDGELRCMDVKDPYFTPYKKCKAWDAVND